MRAVGLAVILVVAGLAGGCTSHNALTPDSVPANVVPSDLSYDINIPSASVAFDLKALYPTGIHTTPLDAQAHWNYTATYQGSPNVYYGPTAPHCEYPGVGIVVAPVRVAGMFTFTAADWPGIGLDPGVTYTWLGRFVYTAAAAPGSYTIDPTGATCAALLNGGK